MGFTKISAPSLTDLFVHQIENMILSGELTVGEQLPPARELSAKMGVSRTVINAGLVELEKLGFVEVQPRQGVYICDYRRKGSVDTLVAIMRYNGGALRKNEVRSLLEVREALECLCLRLVLENVSMNVLENLSPMLEAIQSAESPDDAAERVYDFHHEWEIRGDEEDDNEKCWLHYIFHKNDGYLAPITLHPYRDKGNIDINKEKSLSKQRLLSLFLNADNPNQNAQSFRRVNGKDAETLVLKEQKESKLHTKVIADYFRNSRQKVVFNTVLNQISNVDRDGEFDDKEYERLIDTVLPYFWEESLDEVINQDEGFKSFVEQMIVWLERNQNKVFSSSSDIRLVLRRLNELNAKYSHLNLGVHGRYGTKYGFLVKLNAAQLGRLDTVYRIMKFHGIDPAIAYKNFNDLTLEERCWHYIVYKTWSILETYPQYTKRLEADKPQKGSVREYGNVLEDCMQMIMSDRDSHVTRKLRQVFNFFDEGLEHGGLYERLGNWRETDNSLLVDLDTLKDHYYGGKIKPDHLPPAIYEWDLEFRKVGDLYNSIEFDSFSSGEKQMLNSIGAIIYHLQNLETSSTVIYSNVNIILEEIELYYHPECQRGYINRLLELIAGLNLENIQNINVIFVTHSPFILSDIPKNHVLFLNDGIAQNTMQENTFGANIHSLLKNGFFLPNLPMGEFAYQKINELFRKLNTGDIDRETELEDVYQQILLVGEPFLRNQLLGLYHALKGN